MTPTDASDAAWDAIARRDLRDWGGLPHQAQYEDFDTRFPRLVDDEGTGLLGAAKVPARYRMYVADGYPSNLQAWHVGQRLVLVEATLPELIAPDELVSKLTVPTETLDFVWGVMRVADGAKIFPERGIVLYIGPEGQILRFSLFEPTTAAEYMRTLHYESELVELPLEHPADG
jgi:hypothetical protein